MTSIRGWVLGVAVLVAAVLLAAVLLADPAAAGAQWQPQPVRGFTEPAPMPRYDAGGVAPDPTELFVTAADPGTLGPGQFVFESGSGVPVFYGAVDLGLGRGFALGVEAAYHVESTMRLAARAQWGIAWEKISFAASVEGALPFYLEDRDVAPDSINDGDGSIALRLRGGVRLGPTALLYLEPIMRIAFDGNPPVSALGGLPGDTEVSTGFGAGVGAVMRLAGPVGLHAVARGESGTNRVAQAVEFRFGLTLTTDALLRPAPQPERPRRRQTARR